MKTDITCPHVLICIFYLFVSHALTSNGIAQIPDSLEGKVDMLGGSVGENDSSKAYFLKLGPEVVPIVTQKLKQSLSEGASPEGSEKFAIIDMPEVDQKRVRHQIGLITMQGIALENMSLAPEVRKEALDSLYKALRSPYQISRKIAMYWAAYGAGSEAIDQMIPLLNDPEISNRYTAAEMLAIVGDASTADKIEEVLEQRRRKLNAQQVEKDGSFRVGYEAIRKLRSKAPATP